MRLPTPSLNVEKLQKSLHVKAKSEASFRFYTLWDKVHRADVIDETIAEFHDVIARSAKQYA